MSIAKTYRLSEDEFVLNELIDAPVSLGVVRIRMKDASIYSPGTLGRLRKGSPLAFIAVKYHADLAVNQYISSAICCSFYVVLWR